MTADVNSNLKVQIAHVLAMDVVEYSKLLITEQNKVPCRADPDCEGDRAIPSDRSRRKTNSRSEWRWDGARILR
jgi:hypothetical protein